MEPPSDYAVQRMQWIEQCRAAAAALRQEAAAKKQILDDDHSHENLDLVDEWMPERRNRIV